MAAGWPRRGFRNRGPVRESGSERRSRCGAACIASVRVWRRAIFFDLGVELRGRLRESCVSGACPERAGGCVAALCRGDRVPGVFFTRMANVRLAWQAVGIGRVGGVSRVCRGVCVAALWRGDWVRGALRARKLLRVATCVSRGRCGTSDALMCSGRHETVDPRGRRNESCAVAKIGGFRGPVRQIACAGARWALRNRGRRRESVDLRMGAGSGRFVERSGRLRRVRRAFGAVPWHAVAGCDDGGRVRCTCGACSAVRWGLLLGLSPGRRCAMGIAAGRVAWVALCHRDCCWASRVGIAVPWGLLGGPSSPWRRVIGIADEGMVWVAPCD